MSNQKVTPFLWFESQAEEAAKFYVSVFKNSRIIRTVPGPNGSVLTVDFVLDGVHFVALNGGPHADFNDAVSFSIDCHDQAEVDYFWDLLSEGGTKVQCGWLHDKFGVRWQVVPRVLSQLLSDPARAGAIMEALMQMSKIEIDKLESAGQIAWDTTIVHQS